MSPDRIEPGALRWAAVVPVKELRVAKSRLAGLAAGDRADLALAMACDVVVAARDCDVVDGVLVVTNDLRAARTVAELGATVVADVSDAGLNAALRDGARYAAAWYPRAGIAALSSDLPCLLPFQLETALAEAARHPRAVVPDHESSGTTMLTALPGVELRPDFGPGSRSRHVSGGARQLDGTAFETVRRDVDTAGDLAHARALGVGRHTAEVLARLPAW